MYDALKPRCDRQTTKSQALQKKEVPVVVVLSSWAGAQLRTFWVVVQHTNERNTAAPGSSPPPAAGNAPQPPVIEHHYKLINNIIISI